MMRRLLLFRHAKSSWDEPELADVDRPLAARGRAAAPRMARHMATCGWHPDLVLGSHAERVRQTWQLLAPILGEGTPIKFLRSLYLAPPSRLLATLRRAADEVGTLMMIGHNPGLGRLASDLCAAASGKEYRRLQIKFPTAALAVIDLDVERWREVTPGTGRLVAFQRPKDLG